MGSTHRSLVFARLGWFLLAGIVLILEIAYLPANVDRLYTDWQVLRSYPALDELVSLQFLDDQAGWALVQSSVCRGDKAPLGAAQAQPLRCATQTFLLRTADGGQSWQEITP